MGRYIHVAGGLVPLNTNTTATGTTDVLGSVFGVFRGSRQLSPFWWGGGPEGSIEPPPPPAPRK